VFVGQGRQVGAIISRFADAMLTPAQVGSLFQVFWAAKPDDIVDLYHSPDTKSRQQATLAEFAKLDRRAVRHLVP
jgi:hypothetical protein